MQVAANEGRMALLRRVGPAGASDQLMKQRKTGPGCRCALEGAARLGGERRQHPWPAAALRRPSGTDGRARSRCWRTLPGPVQVGWDRRGLRAARRARRRTTRRRAAPCPERPRARRVVRQAAHQRAALPAPPSRRRAVRQAAHLRAALPVPSSRRRAARRGAAPRLGRPRVRRAMRRAARLRAARPMSSSAWRTPTRDRQRRGMRLPLRGRRRPGLRGGCR